MERLTMTSDKGRVSTMHIAYKRGCVEVSPVERSRRPGIASEIAL